MQYDCMHDTHSAYMAKPAFLDGPFPLKESSSVITSSDKTTHTLNSFADHLL